MNIGPTEIESEVEGFDKNRDEEGKPYLVLRPQTDGEEGWLDQLGATGYARVGWENVDGVGRAVVVRPTKAPGRPKTTKVTGKKT